MKNFATVISFIMMTTSSISAVHAGGANILVENDKYQHSLKIVEKKPTKYVSCRILHAKVDDKDIMIVKTFSNHNNQSSYLFNAYYSKGHNVNVGAILDFSVDKGFEHQQTIILDVKGEEYVTSNIVLRDDIGNTISYCKDEN